MPNENSPKLSKISLLWLGLSFLCIYAGQKSGLGSVAEPGPGMWAAIVGLGSLLCAAAILLTPSLRSKAGGSAPPGATRAALACLAACVLWLLLAPVLGWLAAAGLALILAGLGAGNSLRAVIMLAALFLGFLYIGLVGLLHQHLPAGILENIELTGRNGLGLLHFFWGQANVLAS